MRVLIVGGLAGPASVAGGVWSVARRQAELMAERWTVTLLGGWLGRPPQHASSTTRYERLRRPFPGAQLRGLWSPLWPLRVSRVMRRIDVAHIHLARDFFSTTALLVAKIRGVPIIAQPHGMLHVSNKRSVRIFDKAFRSIYIGAVHTWLTLSEVETQELVLWGVSPSRIRRVFNVPPETDKTWTPPSEARFSFISRLAPRKQPHVFLAAAVDVCHARSSQRIHFTIAGNDQGELGGLLQTISATDSEQTITYVGDLTPEQVEETLVNSTALVLPSVGEVFPMIVVEALAVGTPVILTSDSAISEVLFERSAAYIADPSIPAVRDAIIDLLDKPELLQSLSDRGRQVASEMWSGSALLSTLGSVYETSLGDNKPRD